MNWCTARFQTKSRFNLEIVILNVCFHIIKCKYYNCFIKLLIFFSHFTVCVYYNIGDKHPLRLVTRYTDTRVHAQKERTGNSVRTRIAKAKVTEGKINCQGASQPTSDVRFASRQRRTKRTQSQRPSAYKVNYMTPITHYIITS